jgi:hypothetical protein
METDVTGLSMAANDGANQPVAHAANSHSPAGEAWRTSRLATATDTEPQTAATSETEAYSFARVEACRGRYRRS